jgi:hypothetical protein
MRSWRFAPAEAEQAPGLDLDTDAVAGAEFPMRASFDDDRLRAGAFDEDPGAVAKE